jgi:3-oxoacyl-[acyl-carrier protein] reductase
VRRVLVLGGSTHLGVAVARELAGRGEAVAGSYRRGRARVEESGAVPFALDAADPASIRRGLAAQCQAWGVPDALVHCLAVGGPCTVGDVTDEEWRRVQDVNVRSAHVAVQELAPRMAERGGGEIVLTAALDGIQPVPAPAHFAASQGALLGMTRALAKELGPRGLRVNLVVLGVLDGGVAAALPERLIRDYKKFSALGRVGTAAEVARAIRWLAVENRYMTGQMLSLTGGM